MSMVLPNDEQRSFDDESEITMFKRTSVPLSHQETDEAGVTLAQLVRCLVERDTRTVHDGKI